MAIVIDQISKRFGDFVALENVSVTAPDGQLTALLGPSGSGKSTLLRIIAGLETPDTGEVWLGDRNVTRVPPQQRGVGFVFQHYAPFKHMNVFDNVAFGLSIRKKPKVEIDEKVHRLLKLVQIDQFADRYPSQLSGGQRQRMALARALAVEPEVLLLDEPFGALDARVRKELRVWLRKLHEETHVTTVFVTHDQEEAMDVSDLIVLMDHGKVEQVGPPRELYEHPANEFVMGFIGEVNRLDGTWVRPHDIDILLDEVPGSVEALIERVVYLGFEVRVELVRRDGSHVWAQVPRDQAEQLELRQGQIVNTRAREARTFPSTDGASTEAAAADGAQPASKGQPTAA
jgi:sulfate/thiosulfate transport system ATP-binding protein